MTNKRQVVLDTETTGISTKDGHRIIEIGAVELIDRRLTGHHYHQYLNPNRAIDEAAQAVHGIKESDLQDKPFFADIVDEFLDYIKGAELIIHNAPFDVGFLNYELELLDSGANYGSVESYATVFDTLVFAKERHPGQRNSLDALCRRYEIDNGHRVLHGALLDSEILAEVYLAMTGGQTSLFDFGNNDQSTVNTSTKLAINKSAVIEDGLVCYASEEEQARHKEYLKALSNNDDKYW